MGTKGDRITFLFRGVDGPWTCAGRAGALPVGGGRALDAVGLVLVLGGKSGKPVRDRERDRSVRKVPALPSPATKRSNAALPGDGHG